MCHQNLRAEANYFVHVFFNKEVDHKTIERYIGANEEIFTNDPKFTLQNDFVVKMIKHKADIEALEFAWRTIDKDNVLSKKICIIFYILEAKSAYVPFFVNRHNSFFKGCFILVVSVLCSAYRYLKGRILLKRHHIV